MRTILTLLGISLLTTACRTKEPDAVGIAKCHVKCTDPQIKLVLPFTSSQMQGAWMITHSGDGSHHDTANLSNTTLYLYQWNNYDIYIPAAWSTYVIGAISVGAVERDVSCDETCTNPVLSASVWYNWTPHPHSVEMTADNEYTIKL